MENEKDNIFYEGFHKNFDDWQTQPPAEVWDKIEARLDEDKKRPLIWWWLGGLTLLLIIGGGVALVLSSSSKFGQLGNASNQTEQVVVSENKNDKPSNPTEAANIAKPASASVNSQPVSSNTKVSKPLVKNLHKQETITKSANSVLAIKPKNNSALIVSAPKMKGDAKEPKLLAETKPEVANPGNNGADKTTVSETESHDANSITASNKDGTQQGNIETETSMSASQKPKPLTKADSVKKDSVLMNSVAENMLRDNMGKKDKEVNKQDSMVQKKKPGADSVQKPVMVQAVKDSAKPLLSKPSLFSISGFAGPEQEQHTILTNNSVFDVGGESSKLHFIYGLRASIRLNKKFEVSLAFSYSQSGINYTSSSYLYFNRYLAQPYIFNSSYGDMSVPAATMLMGFSPLAPPSITMFHMNYQYAQTIQFMNVPVCIRFNLGTHKLKPYVTAGVNIQYMLSVKAEVDLLKEVETDVINYTNLNTRRINIAPTVSLGLDYSATKHISFFIEPNIRYNLLSSSTSSTINSASYFIGCFGGLRVSF
jgi:hypothetical protein